MNSSHIISISKDFSNVPLGRFVTDSKFNGTTFRLEYLIPALAANEHVVIDLDKTEGYGSSFLEEAFGGLVREHSFKKEELDIRLSFISNEDPTLIDEILQYIADASLRNPVEKRTRETRSK
jgi:hypothetical protein